MGKTIQLESGDFVKTCKVCGKDFKTSNRFGQRLCPEHVGQSNSPIGKIKPPIGMAKVEKTCTRCGKKFMASPYHPKTVDCKDCRKVVGKVRRMNTSKCSETLVRDYNVLNDDANVGVRLPHGAVQLMKDAIAKDQCVIELDGIGMCRVYGKQGIIGIGYGAYRIEDDKLVLHKAYRKL